MSKPMTHYYGTRLTSKLFPPPKTPSQLTSITVVTESTTRTLHKSKTLIPQMISTLTGSYGRQSTSLGSLMGRRFVALQIRNLRTTSTSFRSFIWTSGRPNLQAGETISTMPPCLGTFSTIGLRRGTTCQRRRASNADGETT